MVNILQHLKRTGENEWKLEDSANYLLYATRRQVELYSQYARVHCKPEQEILEAAGPIIVAGFGDTFNMVGLAAGPSERESILIKAALKHGKQPRYFAIDKSFEMLRESGINIPKRAESYYVLADLFKIDLPELREMTGYANLITFLGYTAFNFGKRKSISYLQQNLSVGDSAVITVGTLPPSIDQLVTDYSTPEIRKWFLAFFAEMGFTGDSIEYKAVFNTERSRIKLGGVALDTSKMAQAHGIKPGDFLVLATSVKLPLDGKGGYLPLISKYMHIDDVFTKPTGMTAVVKASAKK